MVQNTEYFKVAPPYFTDFFFPPICVSFEWGRHDGCNSEQTPKLFQPGLRLWYRKKTRYHTIWCFSAGVVKLVCRELLGDSSRSFKMANFALKVETGLGRGKVALQFCTASLTICLGFEQI